jgi:hypothetical protein
MPLLSNTSDQFSNADFAGASHNATASVFAVLRTTWCKRLNAMAYTAAVEHLDHLIASGAWTDAALALIAIELPRWKLRRLSYDEGEWHCALSSQREMPDWLDASIEAHHPDMAMAILDALRDVIRSDASSHLTTAPSQPLQSQAFEPMLCDNYA